MKFDWWVVIDMDYRILKVFRNLNNLVKLFTAWNWIKFGLQIPRVLKEKE